MPPSVTILIVDDDEQNRKLLEMLLGHEAYSTVSASSGEEALAMIAVRAPDLILLDVILPAMSGHDMARQLKADAATSGIPIIMITAKRDREARLAGLTSGAEEFLTKPIDRAELWLRVRNLLRLKAQSDLLSNHSADLERQVQARTADLQLFRTAMDSTADGIFLINRATMRFVEVNTTASVILGRSRSDLLGMCPTEIGGGTLEDYARRYDAMIALAKLGRDVDPTEISLLRPDGTRRDGEVRWHALRAAEDWFIVAVLRDITAHKEGEERLHRLANYDALTGLPNRRLFYDTLGKALARAADRGWTVAVLFIDLDRFKDINDTLGHAAGDSLLQQFAERLADGVRLHDTIGRLGGDEFAVILTTEDVQAEMAQAIGSIRDTLRAPYAVGETVANITASIGITVYPDDARDAESMIRFAETAMFRAKDAGRDTFCFFTAQMNDEVVARLELERALRQAIDRDEFRLVYQPKVRLADNRIVGFEALLRWDRPGVGLVSPAVFVPVLEETGLIVRVGAWVIAAACAQIGLWLRGDIGAMPIAVNVAARQFTEGDLEAEIARALASEAIPAELLELELTESTLMANTERTIATLRSLKDRGVQLAIDDFGTGYSSLAYLRRFTIDKVKIDIAFVQDITRSPDDAALVLAIINMAHGLRLGVIAEGVETAEQLAYLRQHGCDQAQGYHLGKPAPAAAIEAMLRDQRRQSPTVIDQPI